MGGETQRPEESGRGTLGLCYVLQVAFKTWGRRSVTGQPALP